MLVAATAFRAGKFIKERFLAFRIFADTDPIFIQHFCSYQEKALQKAG